MAESFTIDANVFVSALNPAEVEHHDSLRFFELLKQTECLVVLPTLVRPEIAGAIARTTYNPDLGRRIARLAFLPGPTTLIPLDDKLAAEAADLAASACVKGPDAVYAAVARRFDTTLVTLDRELQHRLPSTIICRHPREL